MCKCICVCNCKKKVAPKPTPAHYGHPPFCGCPQCHRVLNPVTPNCPNSADM